jgi:hypothetical protein
LNQVKLFRRSHCRYVSSRIYIVAIIGIDSCADLVWSFPTIKYFKLFCRKLQLWKISASVRSRKSNFSLRHVDLHWESLTGNGHPAPSGRTRKGQGGLPKEGT